MHPLPPELDSARDAVRHITSDIEDVLTYALYPVTGMKFIRIKHGLDSMPDEMKPNALAEDPSPAETPAMQPQRIHGRLARSFSVHVDGETYQVAVEPLAPKRGMRIAPVSAPHSVPAQSSPPTAPMPEITTQEKTAEEETASVVSTDEIPVTAPIPGVVLRYAVEVGQSVSEGDSIVVLEAMKMENTLPAPATGTVKALVADLGATVAKDAVLAVISI